jgi:hypothetical protein
MVDQAFNLRAGDAGPEVTGTPGNVLTFQADGKVRGEAPAASANGALRAKWAYRDTLTFSNVFPGDVSSEPGVFADVAEGDLLFIPPLFAAFGAFHSASAAPELGGLYVVTTVIDTEHIHVVRDPRMATAAQIAEVAIVSADQGGGAGIYQVATPAGAVIDVDPQVMPQVALPPLASSDVYFLISQSSQISWQIGSINSP